MSGSDALLQQTAAQAVGWALLHFVWQGTLIAAVTAIALRMLRSSAADVRYVVATIGLSVMFTMPLVTAGQTWGVARSSTGPIEVAPSGGVEPLAIPHVVEAQWNDTVPVTRAAAAVPARASAPALLERMRVEPWLPAMVLGWLCGVAILTLRLLSGWLWVQRMKSHGAVEAGTHGRRLRSAWPAAFTSAGGFARTSGSTRDLRTSGSSSATGGVTASEEWEPGHLHVVEQRREDRDQVSRRCRVQRRRHGCEAAVAWRISAHQRRIVAPVAVGRVQA